MHSFTFELNAGPLPLRFGMTPAQVEAILGPADAVYATYFGNREDRRQNISIGYTAGGLLRGVVFTPGVELKLFGHDLFSESDPITFLRHYDPQPVLFVGFVVFPRLGIRLSGYRRNDEEEKAIGVTLPEEYLQHREDFIPFTE